MYNLQNYCNFGASTRPSQCPIAEWRMVRACERQLSRGTRTSVWSYVSHADADSRLISETLVCQLVSKWEKCWDPAIVSTALS